MSPVDLPPHIAAKIAVADNGCWIWIGAKIDGYGRQWWNDGQGANCRPAHRVVYCLLVDPTLSPRSADRAHVLDHLCGNKSCVNPEHVEPVSQSTNLRRAFVRTPKPKRDAA